MRATSRSAVRLNVPTDASQLVTFGPFEPGEVVVSVRIAASCAAATAPTLEAAAHATPPADSTVFATGVPLWGDGTSATTPQIRAGSPTAAATDYSAPEYDIPIEFYPDASHRYLSVLISQGASGQSVFGYIAPVLRHR